MRIQVSVKERPSKSEGGAQVRVKEGSNEGPSVGEGATK